MLPHFSYKAFTEKAWWLATLLYHIGVCFQKIDSDNKYARSSRTLVKSVSTQLENDHTRET